MSLRSPLGISDFETVRTGDSFYYVDKSRLIDDLLQDLAQVLLLPRPRRFGKTLNLSMLRCFFEKSEKDPSALFENLAIWQSTSAREHFQRYPVIFLTFKDVKQRSWDICLSKIQSLVGEEYSRHRYLLDSEILDSEERTYFENVIFRRCNLDELERSLRALCTYLTRFHGEKVFVLIDEYDSPIHESYLQGYYNEVISFFRNFFSGAFKDNPYLFKGVLTGILRVAKESIFSGLNNLTVYSILVPQFATHFGFTEAEVEKMAHDADCAHHLEGIRYHYNGYDFGGHVIYNPWSVLNFLAYPNNGFRSYWASTSSNDLIRHLLIQSSPEMRTALENLLHGEQVEQVLDEHVVLRDLETNMNAVWSLLYFSGYLKAPKVWIDEKNHIRAMLAIVNHEVRGIIESAFSIWFSQALGGSAKTLHFWKALLTGNAEEVEDYLADAIVRALSFHDVGGEESERVYHALILGMLVQFSDKYDVWSNPESGYGRADVLIMPKQRDNPGVVLEFKVLDKRRKETPEAALERALKQIHEKNYAVKLRERGANPIHEIAIALDGKQIWVKKA